MQGTALFNHWRLWQLSNSKGERNVHAKSWMPSCDSFPWIKGNFFIIILLYIVDFKFLMCFIFSVDTWQTNYWHWNQFILFLTALTKSYITLLLLFFCSLFCSFFSGRQNVQRKGNSWEIKKGVWKSFIKWGQGLLQVFFCYDYAQLLHSKKIHIKYQKFQWTM